MLSFQKMLREIFNEANSKFEEYLAQDEDRKKEGEKQVVAPRLVEHSLADVLFTGSNYPESKGPEATDEWFYFNFQKERDYKEIIDGLYKSERKKYKYKYVQKGGTERLVQFDFDNNTFWINEEHEFARAHMHEPTSKLLLEDFVTAEALLEVYLRENNVPYYIIGDILEKRDALLRSLALDHYYSFPFIAKNCPKYSAAKDLDLEIALVIATRALGFVSKHIAGAGEPDGLGKINRLPKW